MRKRSVSSVRRLRGAGVIGAVAAVFALALSAPASAKPPSAKPPLDNRQQYNACMQLAKEKPTEAFDSALSWKGLGGGDAAEHCAAVALLELGRYEDAAGRLETLASKTKENAAVKAGLLAQAARAWLLGGKSERAEGVLTAALKLAPNDAALLVDRAEARAGQKNYHGAVDDLTRAIQIEDRRPDAYVFRAAAYRFLDKLELAAADIEKALRLQPGHVDGLLERGILRRLKGDDGGARQDWLEVLRLQPQSPAAESARTNLENMDVKRN
jgi:tetratricopeptide (TPR) repeat protein